MITIIGSFKYIKKSIGLKSGRSGQGFYATYKTGLVKLAGADMDIDKGIFFRIQQDRLLDEMFTLRFQHITCYVPFMLCLCLF